MMGLIITVHVLVCILLIVLIMIQRGRGGGLVDTFSDVESMFGAKTNAFLTKTTTVLSVLFFVTCLSLAILSIKQSRSLMKNVQVPAPVTQTKPLTAPAELPKQANPTNTQGTTPPVTEPQKTQ